MIAMTLLAAFTIVAFGDSTTAKRDESEVYSDTLSRELRIDGAPVQVINAGIPKNNTADARKRFQTDVLDKNPQAVIIQFGINDSAVDVWENPPKTESRVSLADFSDNLEYFITTARERGIRVILMTPNPLHWTPLLVSLYGKPPYVADDPQGLNVTLRPYVARVREIAERQKVELIDVYATLEDGERLHGRPVSEYLSDGIHPNQKGHRLVADLLLGQLKKTSTKTP
jgi:lysophospholipase L1-like esterase